MNRAERLTVKRTRRNAWSKHKAYLQRRKIIKYPSKLERYRMWKEAFNRPLRGIRAAVEGLKEVKREKKQCFKGLKGFVQRIFRRTGV